jgi:hypothetical protein
LKKAENKWKSLREDIKREGIGHKSGKRGEAREVQKVQR